MPQEPEFKGVLEKPIDITPESTKNDKPRKIRVTNRLDLKDLSNLHLQIAATVLTQENAVLALVDRALRVNGLVPSWVIDETIERDGVVKADGVFLDRICGAETYFQLLHKNHYLRDFSPAVYLINNSGGIEPAVGRDLSRLRLSDYSRVLIGVQFAPVEMPIEEITRRWFQRYDGLKGLSRGGVELTPIRAANGRELLGAYSLIGGMVAVQASDIPGGNYELRDVYSKDAKKMGPYYAKGASLVAVADKKLSGRAMYRVKDTYIDGERDKQSNVCIVTVPGLERAVLRRFKPVDVRDIGLLIEMPDEKRDGGGRTEPGKGRKSGNETHVEPGMKYDIVVMVQGIYNREDFKGAQ